jgi:hypothetical protein
MVDPESRELMKQNEMHQMNGQNVYDKSEHFYR